MAGSLTGTRIREHRRRRGLSQSELARRAGISASYLNLIEHNKRGIAGKVLLALARELDVPTGELSEEADSALVTALQQAAAYRTATPPETARIIELIGRFPDWAALLATLYRQTRDHEQTIAALSDRLTHDPFLAESLHLMLSNITAIRSANGILASVEDIDPAQRQRFHAAIKEESRRLSDAAAALTEYFDRAADHKAQAVTPEETMDRFLEKHGYRFAALDRDGADSSTITAILKGVEAGAARTRLRKYLDAYLANAQSLPLEAFAETARRQSFDPAALARHYNLPLRRIFQRLVVLGRTSPAAPESGLLVVNAAGQALERLPLAGFPMPRHGNACARWTVFRALSHPGQQLVEQLETPEGAGFVTLSMAMAAQDSAFGQADDHHAAMLVVPLEQARRFMPWLAPDLRTIPVGTSCRICPRETCHARVEERL